MSSNIAGIKQILNINLWFSHKLMFIEKRKISRIKESIGKFNRKYDNTEIDTYAFEKVMATSRIIDLIYTNIFQSFLFQTDIVNDFSNAISRMVIDNVNQYYIIYNRKIKDESVFYDYFIELIESLIEYRSSMMSVKDCALISIISEKIEYRQSEALVEIVNVSA